MTLNPLNKKCKKNAMSESIKPLHWNLKNILYS